MYLVLRRRSWYNKAHARFDAICTVNVTMCGFTALAFGTAPPGATPYILSISRTSPTSAALTIQRRDLLVIDSVTFSFSGMPDDLKIALFGDGLLSAVNTFTPVVFDNVRVPTLIDRCGDGASDPRFGEECDDGNNEDSDGCSAECLAESPPLPLLAPSALTTLVVLVLSVGAYRASEFRTSRAR